MTWATPGAWTQLTITLNSLGIGARALATGNNPTNVTNEYIQFQLRIRHNPTAPTANLQWEIYCLPETSIGGTYADGSGSVAPSPINLAATFPVRNVTTDQFWPISQPVIIAPGNHQILVVNATDVAAAATLVGGGDLTCHYRLLGRS